MTAISGLLVFCLALTFQSETVFATPSFNDHCPLPAPGTNYIPDESRKHCIQSAHLLVGQPLDERGYLTKQRIVEGPSRRELRKKQYLGFSPQEDVTCQIVFDDFGGSSKKFYCARKTNNGLLFPEDARLDFLNEATYAHTYSYVLLDDNQNELLDLEGEAVEADVIKVKYPDGLPPSQRQRESFTEVATSRIFWALGIPADRMYPVRSVTCEGCLSDPHGEKQSRHAQEINVFHEPTIERKYDGKRLETYSSRQGNTLRSKTYGKDGFGFEELAQRGAKAYQSFELEVLMLAASIVVYHNTDAFFQNRLICPKKYLDSEGNKTDGASQDEASCLYPIAMIQDLGSTFGTDGPGMNPRGDFSEYTTRRVWKNPQRCETLTPWGEKNSVSENARREFLKRLNNLLPHLRDIFVLSRFDQMDSGQGGSSDQKINQWLSAIHDKIKEIVFLKHSGEFTSTENSDFNSTLEGRKSLLEIARGSCQ